MSDVLETVTLENLGPVDAALKARITSRGKYHCPLCTDSGTTTDLGGFREHLRSDHWRCSCGWIGLGVGLHIAKAEAHGGKGRTGHHDPGRVATVAELLGTE